MSWLITFIVTMAALSVYVSTLPDCKENLKFEEEESARRIQIIKSKLVQASK